MVTSACRGPPCALTCVTTPLVADMRASSASGAMIHSSCNSASGLLCRLIRPSALHSTATAHRCPATREILQQPHCSKHGRHAEANRHNHPCPSRASACCAARTSWGVPDLRHLCNSFAHTGASPASGACRTHSNSHTLTAGCADPCCAHACWLRKHAVGYQRASALHAGPDSIGPSLTKAMKSPSFPASRFKA